MMSRRGGGRYVTKVKDVTGNLGRKVNLLGVVVEFSIPRKGNGTDYCTVLKIMDRSQQSPELCVNVFTENIHQLPHIRSRKDIILLCDINIRNDSQNPVWAVFSKSYSSFALFSGEDINDFIPYQASPRFCLLDSDKEFMRSLRTWCISFPYDGGVSDYVLSLKDIKDNEYFDLVCKVLHVCEVSKDQWMLFVWDASDAPALRLYAKLEDEEHNPLPLHIEPMPLPEIVLRKFPPVGTVLRVTASQSYLNLGDHFNGIGHWVRIRNLCCKPHLGLSLSGEIPLGLWKGLLGPTTKIRFLSEKDNSVAERLRNFNARVSGRGGRAPLSSTPMPNILTETSYREAEFATLMDLITWPQNSCKLKCVARVVALLPSQAEDFRSPLGHYRIRMTLEDPTTRIHALLSGEDAEVFFGRYPAIDVLNAQMKRLLGMPEYGDTPRDPPWTEFCIKLHAGASGSRHLHICDTRLL